MAGDETGEAVPFLKMHGLGNDFVIIDQRGGGAELTPAQVRALGDRHFGVGFDQLAVIRRHPEHDAEIAFWNADGSTAGACGNATRCVARLLMDETRRDRLTLVTQRGALAAEKLPDGMIRIDMGPPGLAWHEIPLAEEMDTVRLPIQGNPGAVSMGNPHCIYFVDDADAVDLARIGPHAERLPVFPERTNVEFVSLRSPSEVRLRVWERGTGITYACGSGACAVIVAGVRRGVLDRNVTIHMDGGTLDLEWRESDGHVLMTGPIARVFEGQITPAFLADAEAAAARQAS